jgi:hypothetical protein
METLGLVDLRSLSPKARAAANARTLMLDKRAYDVAADVWRHTHHARRSRTTTMDGDDDRDHDTPATGSLTESMSPR